MHKTFLGKLFGVSSSHASMPVKLEHVDPSESWSSKVVEKGSLVGPVPTVSRGPGLSQSAKHSCLASAIPEKLPLEHSGRDFFGPPPARIEGENMRITHALVGQPHLLTKLGTKPSCFQMPNGNKTNPAWKLFPSPKRTVASRSFAPLSSILILSGSFDQVVWLGKSRI